MATTRTTTADANANTASSAVNKSSLYASGPFSLSDAITIIELIYHCSHIEALTHFEKMSTISMDDALNKVIVMTKDYLENKGFKPYVDTDGRYRGYVFYDDNGKKKRKPIAAKTLNELNKKAVQFYEDKETTKKKKTFRTILDDYIDSRVEEGVSLSTVSHDKSDWVRYMSNDPMADIEFGKLTYVDFCSWFKKKLTKGLYNKKTDKVEKYQTHQAKNMRSLLSNLCQYAVDNGYLQENYSLKMGRVKYAKYCSDPRKTTAEQVYQDDEPTSVISFCYEQFIATHNFCYLAIIFAFFLDVRVGELVALSFKDFDSYKKDYVYIHKEEITTHSYDRTTKQFSRIGCEVTDHTKSHRDRYLEITPVLRNLLALAKKVQKEIGLESEYVFVSAHTNDKRLHENAVNIKLRETVNPAIMTVQKSCHKIRKTGISTVCSEISVTAAQNRAGHSTPKTTEDYYNFNTSSAAAQREEMISLIDSKAPAILKNPAVFNCVQTS